MEPRNVVNQLVITTVAGTQAGILTDRLTQDGFYVTQVDSSGGILHEATPHPAAVYPCSRRGSAARSSAGDDRSRGGGGNRLRA